MIIGILAMQGNLEEHVEATEAAMKKKSVDGKVIFIKSKADLDFADALIISGGESTTMWKLLRSSGLFDAIREYKKPIYGCCAGLVLLSKDGFGDSKKTGQEFLGKIDAIVNRNAFGRQKDSFSTNLRFNGITTEAVFIRAPVISSIGDGVEVLSMYNDKIVAAKQGNVVVTAFHPELTADTGVHEYFLALVGS